VALHMSLTLTWPAEVNMMPYAAKEAWIGGLLGQDRFMPVLRKHGVHGAYHDDIGSINMFDVVMLLDGGSILACACSEMTLQIRDR
jgi:hypothetical protein